MRTLPRYLSIYTLWLKSNNSNNWQGSNFNLCNVWWRIETTSAHSAYKFLHSVWELICIFIYLQTCVSPRPTFPAGYHLVSYSRQKWRYVSFKGGAVQSPPRCYKNPISSSQCLAPWLSLCQHIFFCYFPPNKKRVLWKRTGKTVVREVFSTLINDQGAEESRSQMNCLTS